MKKEKLLNAMGSIDDELIYSAMEEPVLQSGKGCGNWMKWGLAAACLCILLTLPVAAANKEVVVKIWQNFTGWEVRTPGRIAIKELAPELLELERGYYPQENIETAEEFLGITLPENALLKVAEEAEYHITFENGDRLIEHCVVDLAKDAEGQLLGINVKAKYYYNDMFVEVGYGLSTELNTYDNGGGRGVMGIDESQNEPEQISYITPSGRECEIFYYTFDGYVNEFYVGCGYMTVDNVLISLYISDTSEKAVHSTMIQILDGFE